MCSLFHTRFEFAMPTTRNAAKKEMKIAPRRKNPYTTKVKLQNDTRNPSPSSARRELNFSKQGHPKDDDSAIDLAAIGIVPVIPKSSSGGNVCKLLVTTVGENDSGQKALVFRVKPTLSGSSYPEKIINDGLRNSAKWAKPFYDRVFYWHDNNRLQYNRSGYTIRLFTMYVRDLPTRERLINYGKSLCAKINANIRNGAKIVVDADDFFFGDSGKSTWSEILGDDQALKLLFEEIRAPTKTTYDDNRLLIRDYFRHGTLSLEVARALQAPSDALDPVHRDELEDDVSSEDNHSFEDEKDNVDIHENENDADSFIVDDDASVE